ncbi:hypothetical protein [Priestia megaterium]|uniref:Uncharacterized protein n=1 Tax=Priestia megaterium TaxID=1404 RepID=A0A6M6E0C1_PRIMG|nr:hypothetical protein [Priestia megaterium]QJX80551.1 hypothetical protein FDZ14_31165 [Priestia megaterium]
MSTEKRCYYVKRTLQKDGLWFWADEVYYGRELEEAGFSVDELLSDYKIEVSKPSTPEKISSPDYYVYPQGEYEKEVEEARRISWEEHSDEPPWFAEGFVDGYIQSSVKHRIKDKERSIPTYLGLPDDFEYTEETLQDDLKAVELFKKDEKKNDSK